jgi:sorting nexin-41/42
LEAWEETKREIEKIPDHPNKTAQIPEEQVTPSNPTGFSAARRNSSTTINGR